MKYLLTIAGSDPGGGAGLQQDLRVFQSFGFWGLSAVTGVTVQGRYGVKSAGPVDPALLKAQLEVLEQDYPIAGIKVGALFSQAQVEVVAEFLSRHRVPKVGDPVFSPTGGQSFLDARGVEAWGRILGPQLTVATPNGPERNLLEVSGTLRSIPAFWVTGGHGEDPGWLEETLVEPGGVRTLRRRRRNWIWTHGTGCAFSSAFAAGLARGWSLLQAGRRAGDWTVKYYDRLNKIKC